MVAAGGGNRDRRVGSRVAGAGRGPGRGFEAYLKQYPEGTFAPLARQRLAGSAPPQVRAAELGRFDGLWNVTVQCPPHEGAIGYAVRLVAEVKDGTLAGQQGLSGQPGSMSLSGKIYPDGKALLAARGFVGDPKTAGNRFSSGTPYTYRVDARFEGTRGVGNRIELRPCTLTFAK